MDVEAWCNVKIEEFSNKANHNKKEALMCFWVSMVGAMLAPLLVTTGEELVKFVGIPEWSFVISKFLPSVLSVLVAFSTAWLQLRKPNNLWVLYRTAQRDIEAEVASYQFKLDVYKEAADPKELLAQRALEKYKDVHFAWASLVPNPKPLEGNK